MQSFQGIELKRTLFFSEWDNLHLPTVRSQRAGQSLHEALEAVEMRILCKFILIIFLPVLL